MSYVKDNLLPNEKVLYTANIHPAIFIPALVPFLGTVCFVVWAATTSKAASSTSQVFGTTMLCPAALLFLLAVVYWLEALVTVLTTEFAVTNKRVIAKRGLIRRRTVEMLLQKVESVAVRQNILGRILGFGTVIVVGTGGTREPFRGIRSPLQVRTQINQIVEDYG
jgi:uncharacterized membrane protein YdbT with pleckstrin-like domain